jgi:glycosyltransferase involved in cell wall biosynthesis
MVFQRFEKKRVMMLFPHMVIPGGALIYTLRLADQLGKRGLRVSILTLRHDKKRIEPSDCVEVIAHPHGPLTSSIFFWLMYPFWQRWLNRKIREYRPDILISHVFPANWWGWLAKRTMPEIPMLWICHEPSAFIHSKRWIYALQPVWKSKIARMLRPFLVYLDKRFEGYGDAIVANSRFTAEQVRAIYGRQVAGIAYPGVDIEEFPRCNTSRRNLLLTVAHLSRFKRIDFLLKVFAVILCKNPGLRFSIVGDGEKKADLKQFAEKLNILENVDFCGRLNRKKMTSMYSRACLYLHGSIEEPFGMAVVEALANGCPVIAHASGGLKEIITPGTGMLLDTLDPEAWGCRFSRSMASVISC